MINRYQYFRPPFSYYNNYYHHQSPPQKINEVPSPPPPPIPDTQKKSNSKDVVWFDLFGIKLYFDDVLILSLLFFLYKEEVKDEMLFIALILLLLS